MESVRWQRVLPDLQSLTHSLMGRFISSGAPTLVRRSAMVQQHMRRRMMIAQSVLSEKVISKLPAILMMTVITYDWMFRQVVILVSQQWPILLRRSNVPQLYLSVSQEILCVGPSMHSIRRISISWRNTPRSLERSWPWQNQRMHYRRHQPILVCPSLLSALLRSLVSHL